MASEPTQESLQQWYWHRLIDHVKSEDRPGSVAHRLRNRFARYVQDGTTPPREDIVLARWVLGLPD